MIPALLKHPNVEIAGAADLDGEPLEKFKSDFHVEGHSTVESLCRSPNVDAIYVFTPDHLRKRLLRILRSCESKTSR